MSEARLVKTILKALREQGGWWIKTHGGAFQRVGLPDIIGCYEGCFISFEVKKPGEDASEIQKHIIKEICRKGKGIAVVIVSIEEALNLVKGVKKYN